MVVTAVFCVLGQDTAVYWQKREYSGDERWRDDSEGHRRWQPCCQSACRWELISLGHVRYLVMNLLRYFRLLCQARINWEGCGRKWACTTPHPEGAPLVRMGCRPARLFVHLPLLSSPWTIKPERWHILPHSHPHMSGWMPLLVLAHLEKGLLNGCVFTLCYKRCDILPLLTWCCVLQIFPKFRMTRLETVQRLLLSLPVNF